MTTFGVDYSFARPGGAALAAAGVRFACRYLEYSHAPLAAEGKFLRSPEVADLHAHGIAIVANVELTSDRMLQGASAGKADALDAQASLAALGAPAGMPVYFSADFDANQASERAAIDAYLTAAAGILGTSRVGLYGGYNAIAHCYAAKTAHWFWQTYAWSGSPTKWHAAAAIQQYQNGQSINGAAVDFDRATVADYGQWAAPQEEPVSDLVRKAEAWTVAATGATSLDGSRKLAAGTAVTSIAEGTVNGVAARLVATSGTAGADPSWTWFRRADLVPVTQGGDAAFDGAVQALILARAVPPPITVTSTTVTLSDGRSAVLRV